MEEDNSKEFLERKKILLLDRENIELKHKFRIIELKFERESNILFHDAEIIRIKLKSEEIRKNNEQRQINESYKHFK